MVSSLGYMVSKLQGTWFREYEVHSFEGTGCVVSHYPRLTITDWINESLADCDSITNSITICNIILLAVCNCMHNKGTTT